MREKDGVSYYNDSKGTNVGAVVKSLAGFSAPVILIAGGVDKGGDYGRLETGSSARCAVWCCSARQKKLSPALSAI